MQSKSTRQKNKLKKEIEMLKLKIGLMSYFVPKEKEIEIDKKVYKHFGINIDAGDFYVSLK